MTDTRAPVVAIVPFRSPGEGKTRMSDELGPDQRATLSGAMLVDVAMALRGGGVDRIVVAASGSSAAATASALGLDVTIDPPSTHGLNQAIHAAEGRVGAVGTLLVVMADLPRLQPTDVRDLIATDAQVVVAATEDGGTGGLLRRPPNVITTSYGERSGPKHLRAGHAAGVRTVSVDLAGFRHDVDTWDDVLALRKGPLGPATTTVLERLVAS